MQIFLTQQCFLSDRASGTASAQLFCLFLHLEFRYEQKSLAEIASMSISTVCAHTFKCAFMYIYT